MILGRRVASSTKQKAQCHQSPFREANQWTGNTSSMRAKTPDRILENMDFVVPELLEAPAADRPAMLENITEVLTRRLL
jgi:hypothetical protein